MKKENVNGKTAHSGTLFLELCSQYWRENPEQVTIPSEVQKRFWLKVDSTIGLQDQPSQTITPIGKHSF